MRQADLGQRIREARMLKGLNQTQLAQMLGLDRTTLIRIEQGRRRVTALELLDFSRELGLRVDWFLSPAAAAVPQHRGADLDDHALIRPINIELEELAADAGLLEGLGRLQLYGRPKVLARPESAAATEELGRSIRDLAGAGDGPIRDSAEFAQRLGMLPFSLDLGPEEADAASMLLDGHGDHGVALINSSRGVGRRRLALAHELAHFMVDDRYQVDFRVDSTTQTDRYEYRLDRVARAILLPPSTLLDTWEEHRQRGIRGAAVRVGSKFRVDMTTLARRLKELGYASAQEADEIRAVRTRKSDIVELNLVVPHDLEGTSLSSAFQQAVIRAYDAEDITIERALSLMRGLFSSEDFTPRPELSPDSLLSVVG